MWQVRLHGWNTATHVSEALHQVCHVVVSLSSCLLGIFAVFC